MSETKKRNTNSNSPGSVASRRKHAQEYYKNLSYANMIVIRSNDADKIEYLKNRLSELDDRFFADKLITLFKVYDAYNKINSNNTLK